MSGNLCESMRSAWQQRALRAADVIHAAAAGFAKPDAIEQARRDYARAAYEMGRWS